jgi:hypothetical protein
MLTTSILLYFSYCLGSSQGSVCFDIEGVYDATSHSIDIQLASMEELARISTARPYTMKHGDFPFSTSNKSGIEVSDINTVVENQGKLTM